MTVATIEHAVITATSLPPRFSYMLGGISPVWRGAIATHFAFLNAQTSSLAAKTADLILRSNLGARPEESFNLTEIFAYAVPDGASGVRGERILVPTIIDRGNPHSVGIRESVRVSTIIAFDSFLETWYG
jgi:hypothetical protein